MSWMPCPIIRASAKGCRRNVRCGHALEGHSAGGHRIACRSARAERKGRGKGRNSMAGKKIRDVMTEGVELIEPDASLTEAAARMAESDVGILPVGENDRLVGVVTDRDIVVRGIAQGSDPSQTKIRDVMTQRVLYCYEDQEAGEAADDMA